MWPTIWSRGCWDEGKIPQLNWGIHTAMSVCQHSSKVNSVLFNSQIGDKRASYSPTSKPVKFTRVLSLQVNVAPGGNKGRGAGGGGEGELEEGVTFRFQMLPWVFRTMGSEVWDFCFWLPRTGSSRTCQVAPAECVLVGGKECKLATRAENRCTRPLPCAGMSEPHPGSNSLLHYRCLGPEETRLYIPERDRGLPTHWCWKVFLKKKAL